mgnify:CR=1 FL=1
MTNLQGFYNEDVLEELLYNGDISRLEFVYHHSQERRDDFKAYCHKRGIHETEDAAEAYCSYLLKREENAHVEYLD